MTLKLLLGLSAILFSCVLNLQKAQAEPRGWQSGWNEGGGAISTRPTPTVGGPFGNGPMGGTLQITCASFQGGYQECPAMQWIAQAWLIRDNSMGTRCMQGSNWGVNGTSLWVSDGCEGVFSVQTGYNPNPNPYPNPYPGPGGTVTCETSSQGQYFTASDYDENQARYSALRQCSDAWGTDTGECNDNIRCY